METFITAHNSDIVCLFKTLLDSTIPHNNENIKNNGYSLSRVDHPDNIKRGGVCIYFRESFSVIRRSTLVI